MNLEENRERFGGRLDDFVYIDIDIDYIISENERRF